LTLVEFLDQELENLNCWVEEQIAIHRGRATTTSFDPSLFIAILDDLCDNCNTKETDFIGEIWSD
jgi:hypothetical protein